MQDNIEIIIKIKKLFELSKNNSNLNEATAATLKAKELMEKYNLSEAALEGKTKYLDKQIIDSIRDQNKSLNKGKIEEWHACLANVLCNNNHCRAYLTNIDLNGNIEEAISVIGYEKDVNFVFMMYSFLLLELTRLAEEQGASENNLFKENFILGAIKKIDIRLKEESARINEEFRRTTKLNETSATKAIQVINTKIKNIDFHMKFMNLKNQNKEIKDFNAFGKGYAKADFIDLMLNKKIN